MAATQNSCMSTASGTSKNALTQVNDLATKHQLPIGFFDCQEHGRARERIFSITIKVGSLSAVGQAHKKQARARAAVNILEPLKEMYLALQNNQANPGKAIKLDLKPNGYLFKAAQANGQKEPTSPPQIQDGPPVACFLIRALVRKLVQKTVVKPEDQGEVVRLLLENTAEKILNQDIPISIKNMRAVAKDLLKDFKLQGTQLSGEDKAFQEAKVKHLNYRLNNFLFAPKQKGLSRLCAAMGKFFRAQ